MVIIRPVLRAFFCLACLLTVLALPHAASAQEPAAEPASEPAAGINPAVAQGVKEALHFDQSALPDKQQSAETLRGILAHPKYSSEGFDASGPSVLERFFDWLQRLLGLSGVQGSGAVVAAPVIGEVEPVDARLELEAAVQDVTDLPVALDLPEPGQQVDVGHEAGRHDAVAEVGLDRVVTVQLEALDALAHAEEPAPGGAGGDGPDVVAVALEDASLQAWIGMRDGTADLYYDKGSLAGLALDILIRDATDGLYSNGPTVLFWRNGAVDQRLTSDAGRMYPRPPDELPAAGRSPGGCTPGHLPAAGSSSPCPTADAGS